MKNQNSIHPHVWLGGGKKNTCLPWKGKGKLAKKRQRLGERRAAHSTTLRSLPTSVNPLSFRTPGSMKGH